MRPVCVKCSVEMHCAKSGAPLIVFDEQKEPYQIWHVDLYQCPICSQSVVTGFALVPYARRGDQDFLGELERALESEHLVCNYPLTVIGPLDSKVMAYFRTDLERAGIDPEKYLISLIGQGPGQEE